MRTRISTIAPRATLLLALSALQCAERIPEPVAVPSVPHISWLISSQQQDRDEQTICQSNPRTECVIRVGGTDTRLLATVHLFLHPSSVDTKYVGTMRVEFLNGSAAEAHDTRIDSDREAGRAVRLSTSASPDRSRPSRAPMQSQSYWRRRRRPSKRADAIFA